MTAVNGRKAAPVYLDQVEREQEEDAGKREVQEQRQQVGARERARAEQAERHHRRPRPRLPEQEREEKPDAECQAAERGRGGEASPAGRREKGQRSQGQEGKGRARPVERAGRGLRIAALRDEARRQRQRRRRHGQVEEEDRAPGQDVDHPAAQQRARSGGQGRESRPGADRAPAYLSGEVGADERQAARYQQGRADALNGTRRDQGSAVGSESAHGRGQREQHDALGEHAFAANAVSRGAADQEQ
jgi:hypothetical protein